MSSASGKTREEINSEEFVKTLNEYVEKNPEYRVDNNTTIKLLKWKLGNNDYPVME